MSKLNPLDDPELKHESVRSAEDAFSIFRSAENNVIRLFHDVEINESNIEGLQAYAHNLARTLISAQYLLSLTESISKGPDIASPSTLQSDNDLEVQKTLGLILNGDQAKAIEFITGERAGVEGSLADLYIQLKDYPNDQQCKNDIQRYESLKVSYDNMIQVMTTVIDES